jgi:glycerophosphoryl diester phosphodiesterase
MRRWRIYVSAVVAFMMAAAPAGAFDLQGHRGARGLAPENTLAAFAKALEIGVTTLETDLAITSDGVLVLSHDPLLNPDIVREADGRWLSAPGPAINTLTLAELKRYDIGRLDSSSKYARQFPMQKPSDGERFPTLTELFELVRTSGKPMRFNIETKISPDKPAASPDAETFARLTVEAIRAAGLVSRATIQSFDWRTLMALKRIAPEIERVCLTAEALNFDTIKRGEPGPSPWLAGLDIDDFGGSVPRLVAAAGCQVWSPLYRNAKPDDVAAAKALGLKVIPWTVNERADMERLIALGVDGIITDYPDRLRAVMAAKDMPLPPQVPAR